MNALDQADIEVVCHDRRNYDAFLLRGNGHAHAALENAAAGTLAEKMFGPDARVRPLGVGLWRVTFEGKEEHA